MVAGGAPGGPVRGAVRTDARTTWRWTRRRRDAHLRRARRAGQPAGPAPARRGLGRGRAGGAAVRRARCRPTSACWPCSRPAPPTCRWTSASPPTGWPTSSPTPAWARCCRCRTCATGCVTSACRSCCASTTLARRSRPATPRRLTAARARRRGRPAALHHLHLGLDRPAQGRGGRARAASATSCGWRPRSTASGRATASTRA